MVMMERIYHRKLREVQDRISQMDLDTAQKLLDEMIKYKPVRLEYYLLQAEIYLLQGKTGNVFSMLSGRMNRVYNYPQVSESYSIFEQCAIKQGDAVDAKKHKHIRLFLSGRETEIHDGTNTLEMDLCKKTFYDISLLEWQELLDRYYIDENIVLYILLGCFLENKYHDASCYKRKYVYDISNMGFLKDYLSMPPKKKRYAILPDIKSPTANIVSFLLKELGFSVISASFNPDTDAAILSHVKFGIILGPTQLLDTISETPTFRQKIRRLSSIPSGSNLWAFGWYGSYLDYISRIYLENCQELINRKPSLRFSIVVPARNSAATLPYTLKTLLEQDYDGSYEILVSDNSVANNYEVEDLCNSINDPRIRYLKTPREFALTKSFEFAYLHTRGEYVIGLGSDDGLFPWTLDKIDQVALQFPDEEIIAWGRAFYAWPDFNGGMRNRLLIPEPPSDGFELPVFYENTKDLLVNAMKNPESMYVVPMLYINSCFKRSYMKTLMEKTGCLWDGICQDIYMGIVNLCINDRILYVKYPMSMAGMSNGSAGASANSGLVTKNDVERERNRIMHDGNVGNYCPGVKEWLVPPITTDAGLVYINICRAMQLGILSEEFVEEHLDWRQVFLNIYRQMDVRDIEFDRKIHEMRFSAMQHGDDFLAWFDENIYHPALEPRLLDEEEMERKHMEKSYDDDFSFETGGSIDGSKYGVSNIYDAVMVFTNVMNNRKLQAL